MKKKLLFGIVVVIVAAAAVFLYLRHRAAEEAMRSAIVSGNGRLEATEIGIASKIAGRIDEVYVDEGDYVTKGQKLVKMQTNVLEAQLAQAKAGLARAIAAEASAKALVSVREAELGAARASVTERESYLDGARKRLERSRTLESAQAASKQARENAETDFLMGEAALLKAKAAVKQAEAQLQMARADLDGARAGIEGARADVARIQADIDDSVLVAPREGRIQYKIAQDGEVIAMGGRLLNLIDLTDAYLTFFLPEAAAGRVRNGDEVRLIFDAMPNVAIPARVTYVASEAQFTPKTVETRSEREKLMFRVKASISPELLRKYIKVVKTGLPGVAYIRLDPKVPWPAFLTLDKFERAVQKAK